MSELTCLDLICASIADPTYASRVRALGLGDLPLSTVAAAINAERTARAPKVEA